MEIVAMKIVAILLITLMMAEYIMFAIPEFQRKRTNYYVTKELLDLNIKHISAFVYWYKLIPGDYIEIMEKMKKKKIYVTKEEIDSIYQELMEEDVFNE